MATTSDRRYVTLRGGPTLPEDVIRFALSLEARGITLSSPCDGTLRATPRDALTDADIIGLRTWKLHLLALVNYEPPPYPWSEQ